MKILICSLLVFNLAFFPIQNANAQAVQQPSQGMVQDIQTTVSSIRNLSRMLVFVSSNQQRGLNLAEAIDEIAAGRSVYLINRENPSSAVRISYAPGSNAQADDVTTNLLFEQISDRLGKPVVEKRNIIGVQLPNQNAVEYITPLFASEQPEHYVVKKGLTVTCTHSIDYDGKPRTEAKMEIGGQHPQTWIQLAHTIVAFGLPVVVLSALSNRRPSPKMTMILLTAAAGMIVYGLIGDKPTVRGFFDKIAMDSCRSQP